MWVSRMETRAARSASRPAMRAASSKGQFNKSAQSNQQNLIGEMETNGHQETARGPESLQGADNHPGTLFIGQCCEGCLKRRNGRTGNCAARRSQGAFATLAVLCPVMIAYALRASPVRRWLASCGGAILALAALRMVRTAAHHQVNYQRRDAQDAGQSGHATPYLPFIRYRQ